MAIPMRTFGNTLSELQAGTNAAQGLDYQRANAQDAINQARLDAFLRLRGQQLATEARASEMAADRATRMDLGRLGADTQRAVAEIDAKARSFDPRMFQSFADIQALNNDNLNKATYAKQLSDARRNALTARSAPMTAEENTPWWPSNARYNKRIADLDAVIAQLDAQAAQLGLGRAPDGGYVVPEITPIVPQTFIPGAVIPSQPAATTPVPAVPMQFRSLTPDQVVPLNVNQNVPSMFLQTRPPAASVVPVPGTTNRFRWTPNGTVAY